MPVLTLRLAFADHPDSEEVVKACGHAVALAVPHMARDIETDPEVLAMAMCAELMVELQAQGFPDHVRHLIAGATRMLAAEGNERGDATLQ